MSSIATDTSIVRFTPWARFQHAAVIVLFVVLVLTGLPQRWPHNDLSRFLIDGMGGIFTVRWYHRVSGLVFSVLAVSHIAVVMVQILARRMRPSMLLSRKDFRDAIQNVSYYLRRTEQPPRFGRYDYRQKFEYWGLIFGSVVMVISGFILYFPIAFSRVLPAELIPAAKVAHSNEALMALAIIIVWHLYSAHLSAEVFPFDSSIFTGRISRERLAHEHPLEYEEHYSQGPGAR